jgi:hypothetical protein
MKKIIRFYIIITPLILFSQAILAGEQEVCHISWSVSKPCLRPKAAADREKPTGLKWVPPLNKLPQFRQAMGNVVQWMVLNNKEAGFCAYGPPHAYVNTVGFGGYESVHTDFYYHFFKDPNRKWTIDIHGHPHVFISPNDAAIVPFPHGNDIKSVSDIVDWVGVIWGIPSVGLFMTVVPTNTISPESLDKIIIKYITLDVTHLSIDGAKVLKEIAPFGVKFFKLKPRARARSAFPDRFIKGQAQFVLEPVGLDEVCANLNTYSTSDVQRLLKTHFEEQERRYEGAAYDEAINDKAHATMERFSLERRLDDLTNRLGSAMLSIGLVHISKYTTNQQVLEVFLELNDIFQERRFALARLRGYERARINEESI